MLSFQSSSRINDMLQFSSKMAAVPRIMPLCDRQFHRVFFPRARIQARQIRITYQRGEILRQDDRILAGDDARSYKGGGLDHSRQSERRECEMTGARCPTQILDYFMFFFRKEGPEPGRHVFQWRSPRLIFDVIFR